MVSLLEVLENSNSSIESAVLDSVLASHKDALNQCNAVLRCPRCTARSENMMLLAFVCEKLALLCEKIVKRYLGQPRAVGNEFLLERQGLSGIITPAGGGGAGVIPGYRAKVSFGDYAVDQCFEWDCIIRVLITLQIGSLGSLLARMKTTASSKASGGAQLSVLAAAEQRVRNVAGLLQRFGLKTKPGV